MNTDTFTSVAMPADEAWARWRAAAGAFGGTVPLYLPDTIPPTPLDIVAAAVRAVELADEASGIGNMPVVGLTVDVQPGSIRLSYGGGRARAWAMLCVGGRSVSKWGVDVDATYADLSGVAESVAQRVAAGEAVAWAYHAVYGGPYVGR